MEFDMGGFIYYFILGLDIIQICFIMVYKMKIVDVKYSGGEFKEFVLDFMLGDLDIMVIKVLFKFY